MAYLDKDAFADRTIMPSEYVEALDTVAPGWVDLQLEEWSAWIDSRLRKRYAVPFQEPYPAAVTAWLTRLVTVRCFLKRGVDATDEQYVTIEQDAKEARDEILEAANGDGGLFDLPLRGNTTATGVSKGGPLGYSERSPYVAGDVKRYVGRNEDRNGGGTYG